MKRVLKRDMLVHAIIVLCIMFFVLSQVSAQTEDETSVNHLSSVTEEVEIESVNEASPTKEIAVKTESIVKEKETEPKMEMYPKFQYSKDWDADDSYLLAKIAMAEAEGCNIQTKTLVILTVLNRVWLDEFPNSIRDVIYQPNQFSPISNGRWDRVEPNEECWEAVQIVMESQYDYSSGCLYFEACDNPDNWHNRHLQFLFESEGVRFYK